MKVHQLYKQIDHVGVANINFPSQTSDIITGDNWEIVIVPTGTLQTWVYRGYIDLAGWTKEDLTLFTQAVDVQNALPPTLSPGIVKLNIQDYVTTRRLTDAECGPEFSPKAGFHDSTMDLMQVVYGEWRSWSNSSEVGTAVSTSGDTFGSGNPTAMDKLHITRVISVLQSGDDDGFSVPAANYVIGAVTKEEKDLVYLERLRRSYVLQGEI